MKTYLVGGAVRDELLGLLAYDHDWVVVGATPQQMLDKGFQTVGKGFPVFLHPDSKEEYALARTERKAGTGYHGFEVFVEPSVTLEEDLIRRDLTINAMAKSDDGEIIDPYGGQQDLQLKQLRHVSDAFSEDPLRVLRVARFAAKLSQYQFEVAGETLALMRSMASSGELEDLTPERVWQEVVKALASPKPSVFFEVLDEVGACEVLFPEIARLRGVTQPVQYHPEGDVWIHTMMVLDAASQLSQDIEVRFAALVHDVGKGITPRELWPSHKGHEAAGVPLVRDMAKRFRLPNKVQHLAEKVTEFHGLVHKGLSGGCEPKLKPKTYLKVLKACSGFKDEGIFEQVLIACEADAKGRLGFENTDYAQSPFWKEVLQQANAVDNQAIIAKGYVGAEIGKAIEAQRLDNISRLLKGYREKK